MFLSSASLFRQKTIEKGKYRVEEVKEERERKTPFHYYRRVARLDFYLVS